MEKRVSKSNGTRWPPGAAQGTARRILVVDDAAAVRDVISNMLSAMGYEVTVASNAGEGLSLFCERPFDLVMTDLEMPDMDGWTFAIHIKDRSPQTPIILITGQSEEAVMEKLRGSCIDKAMFKPFSLKEMDGAIERLTRKRGYEERVER